MKYMSSWTMESKAESVMSAVQEVLKNEMHTTGFISMHQQPWWEVKKNSQQPVDRLATPDLKEHFATAQIWQPRIDKAFFIFLLTYVNIKIFQPFLKDVELHKILMVDIGL